MTWRGPMISTTGFAAPPGSVSSRPRAARSRGTSAIASSSRNDRAAACAAPLPAALLDLVQLGDHVPAHELGAGSPQSARDTCCRPYTGRWQSRRAAGYPRGRACAKRVTNAGCRLEGRKVTLARKPLCNTAFGPIAARRFCAKPTFAGGVAAVHLHRASSTIRGEGSSRRLLPRPAPARSSHAVLG